MELSGKKQILAMIYIECLHACPIIVNTMKQVQASLDETEKENVGFTLISFTPDRDTPEVLTQYAKQYELDNHWTLLQGSDFDTRIFANLIGMKYKIQINGAVDHANTLSIFDEEGVLIKTVRGVDTEIPNILQSLR